MEWGCLLRLSCPDPMDTGLVGARGSCCGESWVPERAFEDSSRTICVPQASGDLESHWAFECQRCWRVTGDLLQRSRCQRMPAVVLC